MYDYTNLLTFLFCFPQWNHPEDTVQHCQNTKDTASIAYICNRKLIADRSAASAYEYAKHWLALVPDDPAAQKLVRDREEYLEEEKALELDLKEREEFIRKETPDDVKGGICK